MKKLMTLLMALLMTLPMTLGFFFEFGNENQTTFWIDDSTGRIVSSDSDNVSYIGFQGESIELSVSGTNSVILYPSDDAYTLNDTEAIKGQNFNTDQLLTRKEISTTADYNLSTNGTTDGGYLTGGDFYVSINYTPASTPVSAVWEYTIAVKGFNNVNVYCKDGASSLLLLDAVIGTSNATYGHYATETIPMPDCLRNGKFQFIVTGHANSEGETSSFSIRNFTYEKENSVTKLAGFYIKFSNMSKITDDMSTLNLESANLFLTSKTFSGTDSALISVFHAYANATWNETNLSFRQQPCGAKPILSNISGCNVSSMAAATFLENTKGLIGITDLFKDAMKKNESNVSFFIATNTTGDIYFYSRSSQLTGPYMELRFTNRSTAKIKLNNGSVICNFDSIKSECNSNFSLPNAYDFIGPQQIYDVDKEDIENDLNTFVDIAGDTTKGNFNITGSYLKINSTIGIGIYPVGGLNEWPQKSIILNSTGVGTDGAIYFYDDGGAINSRLYGLLTGIDLTGAIGGPRGLIAYVMADTFEDAQPIFKILSSGGAASNTTLYGGLILDNYASAGKVLCVKGSDGKIGTCTSAVNATGRCDCA